MKLIKEWGNVPLDGKIFNVHCRNCGARYSALCRDSIKIHCNPGFWHIDFECPCCHYTNQISEDRPDLKWDQKLASGADKKGVEKKGAYGGTF